MYYTYTDLPEYKTTAQLKSLDMTVGSEGNKINWTNFFTYDKNGNITGINELRDDVVSSLTYEYDEAGQLTRYNDQKNDRTWVYVYDVGGNIRTKTEYTYTTGAVGAPIKTYNYSYGDANWKDKLTSYDGKAITYDAIGNPTLYDGRSFTWEAGRQLKETSKAGTTITYKYNESGIRTQKTINGVATDYTLIDGRVTHEQTGTQEIYYRYDTNGNLVSFNIDDEEYFYVKNIQGDVIGILDSEGNLIVEYSYDAWGNIIDIVDTSGANIGTKNPYRYRGYRYDTETGLYYLQSRYYNPEWGRFLNADAAFILEMTQGELLGANLFAYCSNSPVMNVDPDGYMSWRRYLANAIYGLHVIVVLLATYAALLTGVNKAIFVTACALLKIFAATGQIGKAIITLGTVIGVAARFKIRVKAFYDVYVWGMWTIQELANASPFQRKKDTRLKRPRTPFVLEYAERILRIE